MLVSEAGLGRGTAHRETLCRAWARRRTGPGLGVRSLVRSQPLSLPLVTLPLGVAAVPRGSSLFFLLLGGLERHLKIKTCTVSEGSVWGVGPQGC